MADVQIAPSPPATPKSQQLSARATPRNSGKMVTAATNGQQSPLPDLKTSDAIVDKTKPLPTSLQSDFLPEDVLFALTQPPPTQEHLGPVTRTRNLNVTGLPPRKPPNNVWNHRRRDKFKHLIDHTPCDCGAGKDISFLYDVPLKDTYPERGDKFDQSEARRPDEEPKVLELPDTLIPREYHIVKNQGVLGLEYHDDKYTCQPDDHSKHLVQFPSMKPNSRFEVKQLKKTLEDMLLKLGLEEVEQEIKGPTQMHNLLELIKKEQNVYNVVFHEMIRQVSVECIERGDLLSDLRFRYSDLLNRVPRQIKSLHEEVMAQRALDRRLTEELMRFRTTITSLTSELGEVKDHDQRVTAEARQAQEDLKSALAESQKNASLLAEYHDLYELQRKRLEKLVFMLSDEKEIWSTAAYSLALKVTEETKLNTAKRLHVSEKAWSKLASHFAILLSDQDSQVITKLQGHMDRFRDMLEKFNTNLKHNERGMIETLKRIKGDLEKFQRYFKKHVINKDGHFVKLPNTDKQKDMAEDVKRMEELLQKDVENFSGDAMLNGEEILNKIKNEMDGWTECALIVFGRHKEGGKTYPENDSMLELNETIEEMLTEFNLRLNGENGVAKVFIQIINSLETWHTKIVASSKGVPLSDRDWQLFYELLDDWISNIDDGINIVGSTQKEEYREKGLPHIPIDVRDVFKSTQKWLAGAVNGIDSEDAKLVDQVSTLHAEMVKWMVQMLLRLAPDKEGNSAESSQAALLGSATVSQLQSNAKGLFMEIENFSSFVCKCCNGIVMDSMQKKIDAMEDDTDLEYRDLKRLKVECEEWVFTSKLLLCELTGESPDSLGKPPKWGTEWDENYSSEPKQTTPKISFTDEEKLSIKEEIMDNKVQTKISDQSPQDAPPDQSEDILEQPSSDQQPKDSDQQQPSDADQQQQPSDADQPCDDPDDKKDGDQTDEPPQEDVEETEPTYSNQVQQLEVIGFDSNTHIKTLDDHVSASLPSQLQTSQSATSASSTKTEIPNTKRAYEALAAVNDLQLQLVNTEERAQKSEDKAVSLETDLKETQEKLRALERRYAALEEDQGIPEKKDTATVAPSSSLIDTTPAASQPQVQSQSQSQPQPRKSVAAKSATRKKTPKPST